MSAAKLFDHDDPAQARAFIAAHPLAIICRNDPAGPVTALAPMIMAGEDRMIGHIARQNPFFVGASDQANLPITLIFKGADSYISASYYPSKAKTGKVVPTWNYEMAELRGALRFETRPEHMGDYIAPLTSHMEQDFDPPWAVSDAPDKYITAMNRGIVGMDIRLTTVRFVRKLSQNKSAADYRGVVDGLRARGQSEHGQAGELAIAELMSGGAPS